MTRRLTILVPGPNDDDPFELKYYKERKQKTFKPHKNDFPHLPILSLTFSYRFHPLHLSYYAVHWFYDGMRY